jgi:hypothetical protein
MSISGTRKSGRVQNRAKSGAHFVRESANKNVTKVSPKTSDGVHPQDSQRDIGTPLGGFLTYFDEISLIAFRPVWDVYYYTSRREGKPARANPARKIKFAEFAFSRGPLFWRNLRGEGGGGV